jgi:hypothetical protein
VDLDDCGYAIQDSVRSVADSDFCEERVVALLVGERASQQGAGSTCPKPSSHVAMRALTCGLNGKRGGIWPVAFRARASDETTRQFPRAYPRRRHGPSRTELAISSGKDSSRRALVNSVTSCSSYWARRQYQQSSARL